jgi:uncharacterized membrane protein YfcA
MPDAFLAAAAVFVFAGFVKGVIGLGLPTISIGMLALVMPPVQAAALLVLPAILTNLWQMFVGPGLIPIIKRLWPMLTTLCLGTWAASGIMTGPHVRLAGALLGIALIAYAAIGLLAWKLKVAREQEVWAGPLVGFLTGIVTAATGVFVIPSVPYMQAIGFEKDELVQALGLSFMVSTLALAVNVARAGALTQDMVIPSLLAAVAAFAGMGIGQFVRARLDANAFRRWFFIGLLMLGIALITRAFG